MSTYLLHANTCRKHFRFSLLYPVIRYIEIRLYIVLSLDGKKVPLVMDKTGVIERYRIGEKKRLDCKLCLQQELSNKLGY